jgi:threonine dehydrogenase-like Zn-dependent dehydrogenase
MKSVFAAALGRIEVIDRDIPEPGPGEVRLRTTLAGICGSDTHAVAGHHPLLPPPYFPGHEATGTVDKLGEGVSGPPVGTRVILKPNVSCGTCTNCLEGRSNACQTLQWIGCDPSGKRKGAMAEYVLAPAPANIFVVPDEVSDEEAVLVECLATPVHAARIAGDLRGAKVMVIGAGTIGFFSLLAAKRAGAGAIVVSDLDPAKRERALHHGATGVVDPSNEDLPGKVAEVLGGPADVVFDCVANEISVRTAISVIRHSGTLLIVGVPPGDVTVPLAYVQDWELKVQGCANYTGEDIETAIEIAVAGELPAAEVISAEYDLEQAGRAFVEATANTSGKVVLRPSKP